MTYNWKNLITWQNYAHYLLNTIFLFLEVYGFKLYNQPFWLMFIVVFLLFFLNDTFIHIFFSYIPRPLRWSD